MKLAKIEEVVSSLVLRKRNKLPPVAESKEESEDDSSGHSTITLVSLPRNKFNIYSFTECIYEYIFFTIVYFFRCLSLL